MYSLESTIEKIEAQVTDDESRQALLRALKARLAEMQQAAHDASVVSLQNKNSENCDPTETDSLPEQLPTGTRWDESSTRTTCNWDAGGTTSLRPGSN